MENIFDSEKKARDFIKNAVGLYYKKFKKNDFPFNEGDRIAYSSRCFDEEEMQLLTDALLDFWLTSGRFTSEFENSLATFQNVKYMHVVNSGSSANLLAFSALTALELEEKRIKQGDEVICVACAFPTTVSPIIQYGAVPVFLDVTIPQYNIDVNMLESALSEKTKAVFLAHTLGNPFDIRTVKDFCEEHGLWLIEDNCDALGAGFYLDGKLRLTGSIGDIGTFSFYPPHHITMGEGGCAGTNDPLLSRIMLSFRDWGRDCICPPGRDNICNNRYSGQHGKLPSGYDHKYVYSHFGYNLKATDMQAAIGCAQLKKLPDFIRKRNSNWQRLYELLIDTQDELILPEACPESEPSWFGFAISMRNNAKISRNKLTAFLENRNIQTRLLFGGNLIKQPCFKGLKENKDYRIAGALENTDYIMNNTFWIGVAPSMKPEMIEYMAHSIKDALAR